MIKTLRGLFIFAIRENFRHYYETNIISKEDFTMKKMLVLGMTLVVLFVGVVVANVNSNNNQIETTIPDDNTLINWYIKYEKGQDYQATILDEFGDNEYIGYAVYDYEGDRIGSGSVLRSYATQKYIRNN